MSLTILCVSKFCPHAEPFIRRLCADAFRLNARVVIGADGWPGTRNGRMIGPLPSWFPPAPNPAGLMVMPLKSTGCIESVLDEAVAACPDGYILRLDDDEAISPPMFDWIASGAYETADHWSFPRMHLWPDEHHYVANAPLWPDIQTRLSVKAKAGGRPRVHIGSPYGPGQIADVAIEHHKFLCRPLAEREALLEHYERLQPGAGGPQFDMFSVPERYSQHWDVREVEGIGLAT